MQTSETATSQQFLTFAVDDEEYAIAILQVKEIIAYETLTRVPRTESFVRGIINLRGSAVPVIDLATRFGFRPAPVTRSTCIVIVEVTSDAGPLVLGLLVDSVSQVVELAPGDIEPPPQFGFGALRSDFLVGMARSRAAGKFVLLLDIDRVLAAAESEQLVEAAAIA